MKVTNSKFKKLDAPAARPLKRGQPHCHPMRNLCGEPGKISSHSKAKSSPTTLSKAAPPATTQSNSRAVINGEIAVCSATGKELAALPQRPPPFSAFGSLHQFEQAKQMASLLAHSTMVPEYFRGEAHLGNCVIALEIANRVGAPVLAVMQNLHLIQGRPTWSSQFLISLLNASKRFSPIRFQMTGTRNEESWGCIAWATDQRGELLKSPEVTIKMAKEEGWDERLGNKWKTMPELMLCYRSATLFIRLYAPEVALGIQTSEEITDLGLVAGGRMAPPMFEASVAGARYVPKTKRHRQSPAPMGLSGSHSGKITDPGSPLPEGAGSRQVVAGNATTGTGATDNYLKMLRALINLSQHSEEEVMSFLRNTGKCNLDTITLVELIARQPNAITWTHDHWCEVEQELASLKKGDRV